jgi:dienelactone hydrolase
MMAAPHLRNLFEIGQHELFPISEEITDADGRIVQRTLFETADGEAVRGLLTRPVDGVPAPAILYIHAHGGRYDIGADELLRGRPALQGPLGPVLAAMGLVTLAIDMPAFGGRTATGESARAKALLWRGRSLAGQMLGEQAAALSWLREQPYVDRSRIGVFGISMGATLGYWLAAVDARLCCVAQLCCYADFGRLIETGAHDLHGIYLTIPGLLERASNGEIAGLIAPRPQLIGIGDLDPLTPPGAVDIALSATRAAYRAAGVPDNLVLHREAASGHAESLAMRKAVLDFFARHLAPESR